MTIRKPIRSICILGGGTAGWMAAGYLSSQLPDIQIKLIESGKQKIIGVGETSVPQFKNFMEKMGLDEKTWMQETGGSFKYGVQFDGWRTGEVTDKRFHGFHDYLTEKIFSRSPGELNKKTAQNEKDSTLDVDYWIELLKRGIVDCSEKNKIGSETYHLVTNNLAHADLHGHQYMSRCPGYSYNINAYKIGQTIRDRVAKPNNVQHIVQHITHIEKNTDGSISSLVDESGNPHTADLFIDCTGFQRLLIGDYAEWQSYKKRLSSNRAFAGRVAYDNDQSTWCNPYLHATALSNGWFWRVPLADDMGTGYVFDDNYIDPDQAEKEIVNWYATRGKQFDVVHKITFDAGVLDRCASHNVIAVGLSSNFLEPLEATSISFAALTIELLSDILKKYDNHWSFNDAKSVSKLVRREIDYTADYVWAHYALTQRTDTDFWRDHSKSREQAKETAYKWFMHDEDIYRREKDFQHTRYNKYDWALMITSHEIWHECPTRPIREELLPRAKMWYDFRWEYSKTLSHLVPTHWELIQHINNS